MGRSSGDTIPNCLGEFREIRESKQRTGIAPYGHPAGTPGATGVERLGHERMVKGPTAASKEQRIDFSAGIVWFGDILNIEGPFVEIGPRSVFDKYKKDELNTVPLGAPGVHLREVLEDAFHEEIL